MSSSDRSLLSSALFLLFKIDNTAPSSGCPENCSRKCFCQLEADRERWIQSKPKSYKYALNYTACLENNGTNNYQTITSTIRHSEDNDMEAACSFSHVKDVFTLTSCELQIWQSQILSLNRYRSRNKLFLENFVKHCVFVHEFWNSATFSWSHDAVIVCTKYHLKLHNL